MDISGWLADAMRRKKLRDYGLDPDDPDADRKLEAKQKDTAVNRAAAEAGKRNAAKKPGDKPTWDGR